MNREPTLREAVYELQTRYRFWKHACIGTWLLAAVVFLAASQ